MRCTNRNRSLVSRRTALALVVFLVLLRPAVVGASDAADRLWSYIESLREQGRAELALTELRTFCTDHASDARVIAAWRAISEIHRKAGRVDDAIEALTQATRTHPTAPGAPTTLLELAALLEDEGRLEDATATYRNLLLNHPLSDVAAQAQLGYGLVLARRGHLTDARAKLMHLVGSRVEPSIAARAMFEVASIDAASGRPDAARKRWDAIHVRFPGQIAGGEGLLCVAEELTELGATLEAERRYTTLLERFGDAALRAKAHLGLAALVEARDLRTAHDAYSAAANESPRPDLTEIGLRGVVRTALGLGEHDEVREVARDYRAAFPTSSGREEVRLLEALADHRDGRDESERALVELGRAIDPEIAFRALAERARSIARADTERGLACWREAESRAPDPERRFVALIAQAELALALRRAHLAADLALTAHDAAVDDASRGRGLLLATRAYVAAGDRSHALHAAERLVAEHPLTAEATRARHEVREIERQRLLDPREAARRLAELAGHEIVDFAERSAEVALIHRDRLGDLDTALEMLERAIAQARHPEQRGRLELELGRTLRLRAFLQGSRGDARAAASSLEEARDSLAGAALRAGRERSAQHARVLLVALELAARVRPDAPWAFDGWVMPVVGAIGIAEDVDPSTADLDTVRTLLRAARRHADTRDERAWIRWRQAEIARAPVTQRIELARSALEVGPSQELEWSIRTTLGHLLLKAGDVNGSSREFSRVVNGDVAGDVSVSARFGLAEARREQGRYSEARRYYDEVATVHPDRRRGRYALLLAGDCAAYEGDTYRALRRYRRLVEEFPSSTYVDDALYRWGLLLERDGRLDAARDPYERLVNSARGSRFRGRALAGLGRIAAENGRYGEAIDAYAAWIETDGIEAGRGDAWTTIAGWCLQRDDAPAALLWLDRRLRHREPDATSLALRVRTEAHGGDLPGAADALRRLEAGFGDQNDAVATAGLYVAAAHRGVNDLEGSIDLARVARDRADSDRVRSRAALEEAAGFARMGYGPEALDAWDVSIDLDTRGPWAAQALLDRGRWLLAVGDDAAAQRDLSTFVARFPADPRVTNALRDEAVALRSMGRHEDALDRAQRILEREPGGATADDALLELARAHARLAHHETAVVTYRRLLPYLTGEQTPDVLLEMAASLRVLGLTLESAKTHLQAADHCEDGSRKQARARLAAAEDFERAGQWALAAPLYRDLAAAEGILTTIRQRALSGLQRTQEGTPARR